MRQLVQRRERAKIHKRYVNFFAKKYGETWVFVLPYKKSNNYKEFIMTTNNTFALTNSTTMNTSSTEDHGITNFRDEESTDIQPLVEINIPRETATVYDKETSKDSHKKVSTVN